MADFSNSFTGKDILSPLPSSAGLAKSQESMGDMMIAAEKTKNDVFQKNAADFQKAVNIDPVALLGDVATQAQSKLISDFNNTWGGILHQYGGILPEDQKIKMQSAKNAVIMQQYKLQSDMQQAFAAKDAIQKDTQGNLDHDDFQKRWDKFITTGTWEGGPLLPSSTDPDIYFSNDKNRADYGATDVSNTVKNPDGTISTVKSKIHGTEAQGRDLVAAHLHSDDGLARGWIEKFQGLKNTDPSTYNKYLDISGDGTVSPDEEKAASNANSNPILKWAQDNYWDKVIKAPETDKSQKPEPKTNQYSSSNWATVGIGHQNIHYNPTSARPATVGKMVSQNYHEFQGLPAVNISVKDNHGLDVLTGGMINKIDKPVTFTAIPTGYDEDSDKYTFEITKNFQNIGISGVEGGKSVQVAIPRTSLQPELFNNLEVLDDKGNKVKVGQVAKAPTQVIKKKAY
jgi:hypothetical protein